MPTYDFKCGQCETIFERVLRIADMNKPKSDPCPSCGKEGAIDRYIGAPPLLGDSTRMNPQKAMGGFADVLRKIHDNNPKSNLNQKLN